MTGAKRSCRFISPVSMWMKGEILMAKDYGDLTITDDFMFGKIMEDRELCLEKLKMV